MNPTTHEQPALARHSIPAPHAYRKLSEDDLAMMDRVNEYRASTEAFLLECEKYLTARGLDSGGGLSGRMRSPHRAHSIAATELQNGWMWLARAIAAPDFF